MTTAHRATWKAARGGLQEEGSYRLHVPSAAVSSKDAPTEPHLKLRALAEPISRDDHRARLESSEQHPAKRPRKSRFAPLPPTEGEGAVNDAGGGGGGGGGEVKLILDTPEEKERIEGKEDGIEATGKELVVVASPGVHEDGDEAAESEDEDSGDESEDDEAELLAQLEQMRKEREFERAKKQAEEQERQEQRESARVAAANPLLGNLSRFNDEFSDTASLATASVATFAVKRRWDDDMVFRNQSVGEKKSQRRFVNDTIKNDFHRRFMKKYMR